MSITDEKDFAKDTTTVLENPTIQNFTAVAGDLEPLQASLPEIIKETKSGYKTSEFWLTIVGSISVATGLVPTPVDTKGWALVALVALYCIARGLSKKGVPSIEPSPVVIAPAATAVEVVEGAPEA